MADLFVKYIPIYCDALLMDQPHGDGVLQPITYPRCPAQGWRHPDYYIGPMFWQQLPEGRWLCPEHAGMIQEAHQ